MYYPNEERRTKLGRPNQYPWDVWTDGKERVLEEGKDFTSMAESFGMLARRTAKVRGMKVVVSTTSLPKSSKGLDIEVNGETVHLEAGKTYVILKFVQEE